LPLSLYLARGLLKGRLALSTSLLAKRQTNGIRSCVYGRPTVTLPLIAESMPKGLKGPPRQRLAFLAVVEQP
jgi:hypothetical protein